MTNRLQLRAWKRALLGGSALALIAAGAASAQTATAAADPREARIEQLESEVQELAAQVQDLKRGQAAQIETLADVQARPLPSTNVTIASGKPSIASTDGQFTANLHGILQFDAAQYDQQSAGNIKTDLRRSGPALGASAANVDLTHARNLKDGDDFRRARIGVDGKAFGDWDYRLIFDFAGTGVENAGQLYEGWVQYSGLKPFKFRVGAFAPSIGLDDQASTNTMPFLERSAVEDIARGFAAGDTRTAAEIFANGDHWLVSGAVTGRTIGVVNSGAVDTITTPTPPATSTTANIATPQTYGDQLGFVGRIAGTPIHDGGWLLHLGAHGSYVARPADLSGPGTTGGTALTSSVLAFSNTQELRVDSTKLVNTGNIDARSGYTAGVEVALQKDSLLLQSEYESLGADRSDKGLSSPNFSGYYVSGTWLITGERRVYNSQTAAFDGPVVAHPFSFHNGGLGAWELGVRYSELDLNYDAGSAGKAPGASAIRGGEEENIDVGLNWYPNPVVRFMLDFEHVRVDRLSPNATVYQTPTGAQIGQNYNVFAIRSQFAF
jgi:phosphate-selective porin OprO/OprP